MTNTPIPRRFQLFRVRPLLLIPFCGVLVLVALWTTVWYQLRAEQRTVLADAMHDSETFVAEFEQHTLRSIRDADRSLLFVKYEIERTGSVDLPRMMAKGLIRADGFISLNVTDSTGAKITSTHEFTPGDSAADREYFTARVADNSDTLGISKPLVGRFSGEATIKLTRRLVHPDGTFAGIVEVGVSPSYFTDFYQESALGTQGSVVIQRLDGEFLARRTGGAAVTVPGANSAAPVLLRAKLNPIGSFEGISTVDGITRLIAYRQLAEYPMLVIATQSKDEALTVFNRQRATYLTAAAIATAIILLFFTLVELLVIRLKRRARELRKQQGFLQMLLDNVPMGISVRSVGPSDYGKTVAWNESNAILFNRPVNDALGKTAAEVMTPETAARIEVWDRELLASPMVQDVMETTTAADGSRRVLHRVRAPLFGVDDKVEYIMAVTEDVTVEQANADELRLAAKVFETTADAIIVSDGEDRVTMVNAAFTRLSGYVAEDMLGQVTTASPFRALDSAASAERNEALRRDGYVAGEVRRAHKNGRELSLWITATCVRGKQGEIVHFVRVFTDITPLKTAQRELEQLANHDALTGLPNRRLFSDRMEQARRRAHRFGERFGLLFIDLDGFKAVNDEHGHDVGDALLKQVAERLRTCVRESDSVCRLGGDEFTIIVEDAILPQAVVTVAERIALSFKVPFSIGGQSIHCHASVGIAVYPEHGEDGDALMQNADRAMYLAKQSGLHGYEMASGTPLPVEASETSSA